MSKRVTVNGLLLEKDVETLLRGAHNLKPRTWSRLCNNDEKKFDKLIDKVGKAIKKNRKLVNKIKGEK